MKRNLSLSSLSLLLLVIMITLSITSLLAMVSAKADYTLAQKQASLFKEQMQCNNFACDYIRAHSDEPEIKKMIKNKGHYLIIDVLSEEGKFYINKWNYYAEWTEDTDINVYRGDK